MGKSGFTYGQIKMAMERIEAARADFADIPQSYTDRLKAAVEIYKAVESVPAPKWDDVSLDDMEQIERAEHAASERQDLIVRIRQHFSTCAMLVSPVGDQQKRTRRASGKPRRPRRSAQQKAYDDKIDEIAIQQRDKLGFPAPARGVKLSDEQKAQIQEAVEKELKRLKLTPPASE